MATPVTCGLSMRKVLVPALLSLVMGAGAAGAEDISGLGRHKQFYLAPALGKVTVDGKLDDWDLSAQVEMFVLSSSKERQSAKFAMMYDDEALYLSGDVRDPTPMMNRQDPVAHGDKGWNADSVQFRMTFDPQRPYPETEAVFEYRRDKTKVDLRDDIKHLTLWYYTDGREPVLQVKQGMTYRNPDPAWGEFGVVPKGKFEAAYVPAEDGKGYRFEYRIPWSTLGVKKPLSGGDEVAGTVQFNWGSEDGLSTGGASAWAYDVLRGSGFAYQTATIWGRIIFSKTGNVSRELVTAGVPMEKPKPLKFSYELPQAGEISLQLVDGDNKIRRTLIAQEQRTAGAHTEEWDGLDDRGKPLLAGSYRLRGIIHDPIRSEFLFSLHNSGRPPFHTADGTGGWGADHGRPTAAGAFDGGLLLAWNVAEYGPGIIRVDLEGRKQWGIPGNALFLANDGGRFFAGVGSYQAGTLERLDTLRVFDLKDGRPLNFGNGHPFLEPPAGGDEATDKITGLAYGGGRVFVSYGPRNLVAVYDAKSGDLTATWPVPSPGPSAWQKDGSLAAISDGELVSLREGKLTPLAKTPVDEPSGIAVDGEGRIYVANQGALQNVSVFAADGAFLQAIGKKGGRPAMGKYEPSGMYLPLGLAADGAGRIWVAENADFPKRFSVWNAATGKFDREFFGASAYAAYADIDPKHPNEIYCHNVLWEVDWDAKTARPLTTIWRKTEPDMMDEPHPASFPQGFRIFTATNGRQYGWGMGGRDRKTILYRRDGDLFKPFAASLHVNRKSPRSKPFGIPELDDPEKVPDGGYFWQDANDDQRMQLSELQHLPEVKKQRLLFREVGPDLTIWTSLGTKLVPQKWTADARPLYDPANPEETFLARNREPALYLWLDPDGDIYTCTPGKKPALARWSPDGKLRWAYPEIPGWQSSLGDGVTGPGKLQGITGPLKVAGDIFGNMSYFGVCHLFRRNDGMVVATVFKDARTPEAVGPEQGQAEGQGASLVRLQTKPGGPERTLLLGASGDGRITEVHGLDSIRDLPESTFALSVEDARKASDALAAYEKSVHGPKNVEIGRGLDWLDSGEAAGQVLDGARKFKVVATVDDGDLVVRYTVRSPFELLNSWSDPQQIFKGGNCLDIQLAADPQAPPNRKTPAPDDVRVVITRQQTGKDKSPRPVAVLFRPKVKGFSGKPIVFTSPTGEEHFDEIKVIENFSLKYRKTPNGFVAEARIPLDVLGLSPTTGARIRMDLGVLYGNATGSQIAARSYLHNRSFSAGVVNDLPHESRLEPAEWGEAAFR